jgi:hypothetical protein
MGVPYAPQPVPGTDAFTTDMKNWKVDASEKMAAKKVKMASTKKMSMLKIV